MMSLFNSASVTQAWGMTLLHSIWIGAIWSIVLLVALRTFRESNRRYIAGVLAMCGFLISVAATALLIFPGFSPSEASSPADFAWTMAAMEESISDSTWFRMETLMPWFLNFWFFGMILFMLRIAAGLHYLHRIRRVAHEEVPVEWMSQIHRIATELGIHRSFKVLSSVHIDMPMVYGYFRPVLFLPVSLLSGLSADQLEAIFAHELGHIKRNDYLFNLVQRVMEAFFFFNPFIWWISSRINAERERSCDDLAIRFCSDRKSYVRALSDLETFRLAPAKLALGLASEKGDLLHRIRRLIEPDYREGGQHKLIVLALLFTAASFGLNFINIDSEAKNEDSATYDAAVLPAVVPEFNARYVQADTVKPESKKKAKKVKEISDEPVIFELEEVPDIDLSGLAEIDFEPLIEVVIEDMENFDFDFDTDINLSGIAEIEIEEPLAVAFNGIIRLDTNILVTDTSKYQLNAQQREAMRQAREQIRLAQEQLRQINRDEMMRLRDEMMKMREEQREQFEVMRRQFREQFGENGKFSEEDRARVQAELEKAQQRMKEEFAQHQEEFQRLQEVEMEKMEQELDRARIEMQRASEEMRNAEISMQKSKEIMKKHESFIVEFEKQLRADSYLEAGEKLTRVSVSKDVVKFNNREVLEEDKAKYQKLYEKYFGDLKEGRYEYKY